MALISAFSFMEQKESFKTFDRIIKTQSFGLFILIIVLGLGNLCTRLLISDLGVFFLEKNICTMIKEA